MILIKITLRKLNDFKNTKICNIYLMIILKLASSYSNIKINFVQQFFSICFLKLLKQFQDFV